MSLQQILFLIFGTITLGAALAVVTQRNPFHAALLMALSCFGVAGLFVLLEAPYLAAAQVFVYVGGISTLVIFVIVRTHNVTDLGERGRNDLWFTAAASAIALGALLVWTIWHHDWVKAAPGPVPGDSLRILAKTLLNPKGLALPFEVASVLLLVAMVSAITLVRRRQ